MEAVLQQECSTESQLETYKSQLGLVEGQLEAGAGGAEDTADLQQLQEDLTQLITLTEEALLDLKKQRLLLSVQSLDSRAAGGGTCSLFDDGTESRGGEEASREGLEEEEGEREEDDSDDLQGMKCRAPLEEAWGTVNYHNAVIFCRDDGCSESSDGDEGRNGVKVRVLFTHPTYKAMKPCPYYLNGKCRFDDGSCKFSHGHVVLFSDLLTYREPDYNLACIGGKCIAKHSDDLWYPAIISSLDEVFTIHFTTLNTTVEKPLENVFPLEVSESSDSSASSESGEEEEGGEEGVRVVEWTPSGALRALGEWERHTTGIGSRLLAKMGYVVGKGLGRNGEGRVEPVEIKILPAGKSLDMCAEMRERGKLRKAPGEGEGKRKRKRKIKRKLVEAARLQEAETEKVDIFDFLNTKLQKNTPAGKVEDRLGSKPKSGNLNIQLFTVQEEIKSVLKRRQSLKIQLARHKGRDKTMEEHVTEKLTAVGRELERLHAEERSIERSLTLKSERKKLRIF